MPKPTLSATVRSRSVVVPPFRIDSTRTPALRYPVVPVTLKPATVTHDALPVIRIVLVSDTCPRTTTDSFGAARTTNGAERRAGTVTTNGPYVPAYTTTASPGWLASTAAWIVRNGWVALPSFASSP